MNLREDHESAFLHPEGIVVSHTLEFRKVLGVRNIGMCPASASIMFLVPDQVKNLLVASLALLFKSMIFGSSRK